MTALLTIPVEFVAVTDYGTCLRIKCLKMDAGYDPAVLARLLTGSRIRVKLTARSHGQPGQVSLPDADDDLVREIVADCQRLLVKNKRLSLTLRLNGVLPAAFRSYLPGKRGLIEIVEILPAEGTR